ncbi:mannosyltransferase [Tulasnella sp. 425]|nr:mannosyltransferase [Tulasnella sp. 425]
MSSSSTATPPKRIETVRFARPTTGQQDEKPKPKPPVKYDALLHDQLRKNTKGPWCPSFSVAFRILVLIRFCSAIYSNISDCDEVYNFWEPLHYLDQGYGFQTWETSPVYSIRSWAYIALHLLPARAIRILNLEKRQSFFGVRAALAILCALCESKFYRAVVEKVNPHVGRYTLFLLATSAGMWSATSAFLPSSFAMMCNMVAFSYALDLPSRLNNQRTFAAILFFATGGIVGWPFSLAVAIPFVLEEMFVYGKDKIKPEAYSTWIAGRWARLVQGGLLASLLFVPVIAIDSLAYGKLTITPWNIVRYNIFPSSATGPELYGTEPWYFYLLNLTLNFNFVLPLALISFPALLVTRFVEYKRLGPRPMTDESSPFVLLTMRLAPFYLWLGILTMQAHKEERFMFPIYPLLCFNAAVALYLVRGWMEVAYIKATSSPYKASRSSIFGTFTLWVILITSFISISRTLSSIMYYHAPLDAVFNLQNAELPRLLNVTNLLITPPPAGSVDDGKNWVSTSKYEEEERHQIDLSPLKAFGGLKLCYGKEWYRFPGHYLLPEGVQAEFVKSEFNGLLPGHFTPSKEGAAGLWAWSRQGARVGHPALNDRNQEVLEFYADISTCDYLIDSDFPLRHSDSRPADLEPRYVADTATWDKVYCHEFLDAANSGRFSRLLWFPGSFWKENGFGFDGGNKFGEYCLLRNRKLAEARESRDWSKAGKV